MKNVIELESQTKIQQDNSYLISYPHILSYFQGLNEITIADLVRGAHMIYGWMPTVLDLYPKAPNKNLSQVAILLTKVKKGEKLTDTEISEIKAVVNNSLVGASKLLHFISPQNYAIWDSKIYKFVCEKRPHNHRVNKVELYTNYLNILEEIKKTPYFSEFHNNVNKKVGYEVTPFRAIELVMFLNAPENVV